MQSRKLRNLVFLLRHYLGLAIGLIVMIISSTGSLLVFHTEINDFQQGYKNKIKK